MRRSLIKLFQPESLRSGVTVKVISKNTSVQVPVERVMNSIGLAPSRSVRPKTIRRASGNSAATNSAALSQGMYLALFI